MEKGYEPWTSFDWQALVTLSTLKEKFNREEAKAMVIQLHEFWQKAKAAMTKSQERYTTQANRHQRPVNFRVGNKV
jgi:hypothetical protein